MACRLHPENEKGSRPALVNFTFTSIGFGVIAMTDTLSGRASAFIVLRQRHEHTVGEVGRELHPFLFDFLLPLLVRVADRDEAGRPIHRHLERLFERRPFLDQVIGQQQELLPLRVDGRLVADRAVLVVKDETARHAIAPDGLDQVAAAEQPSVRRRQREKTVRQAFEVADRDRLS